MCLFSFDDCINLGYSRDSLTILNWIDFGFKNCFAMNKKNKRKTVRVSCRYIFNVTSEVTNVITRVLTNGTFMTAERICE